MSSICFLSLLLGVVAAIAGAVARGVGAVTRIDNLFDLAGDVVVATNGKITEIAGEGKTAYAVADVESTSRSGVRLQRCARETEDTSAGIRPRILCSTPWYESVAAGFAAN